MNHGGGIFISEQSSALIGATFQSNYAHGDGGGLASVGYSELSFLHGTHFRKNQAGNRGGGIFVGGIGAIFGEHLHPCALPEAKPGAVVINTGHPRINRSQT